MAFNPTWTGVARLVMVCCLLSACGGKAQKSAAINPQQRFDIARAAETSGNVVMAREMYGQAAAETEGDRTMQLKAAEGLDRIGASADAIPILQALLKRSPGDQEARRTLGKAQIMNGSLVEAVETLSVVLAARPDDDNARINKAVALDMLHRYAEAQPLYRAALARNPSDAEATNDLALSLMLSGQTEEARVVLAPFRGRTDLPERLRTTMNLADGGVGTAAVPDNKPVAPASLKKPPPKRRPAVKSAPVRAPD